MRARGRFASGTTIALAGLWYLGCAGPAADPVAEADHSHSGGGLVTHWTDAIELFVEFPPHVRDVPSDPWAIHLTWLEDWQPVRQGSLTLLLRGPGGAREEIVMDEPDRPGVYTATPTLGSTGTWRADLTLAARDEEHAIPVGQLQVFESEDALPHDVEQPPPNLIALLKEQQWSMPFQVALAEQRRIPRTIPAAGEIVAPGGALAHVSTLVAGLIVAGGAPLGPGDRVETGQTLALIAPTSLENSYARMRADVVAAEREAGRAERLFASGAIPARRLEHARHELEVALAAFAAIGGVPARHVGETGQMSGGWFTVEGGSQVYQADRLVSVGTVVDPQSRTLPVRLAVPNPTGALKVGMLANGHLLVGEPVAGVAVPADAVQDEDGLAVVYVKVGGEAFQRRVVELGPSDGTWTLVASGVTDGEQVVTTGAYQVRLASLGDAEVSDHGHPH